ncbi:stimulator of interferon genes protein-like [Anneissia japonica]|uniref:stimulator of interferon genes protein-like n=1 Tax=Anneissia japonica TaxID=1529436 RepID=UPI00142592AA|nr:stimulator of interferon genes protein-like [Anneissia japonica]
MGDRSSNKNYAFGEIPKKRGTLAGWTAGVLIMIFAGYYGWRVNSKQPIRIKRTLYSCLNQSANNETVPFDIHMYHYLFSLLIILWGAIFGKFTQCFCRFVEELRHLESRHSNSYFKTIQSCFQVFFTKAFVGGVGMMFIAMYFMWFAHESLFDHHVDHIVYWPMFISSVGVSLITNYMLGFKTLSEVELSLVQESNNTNVAQGMGWSYFTGYLRIILPKLKETISRDPKWKKEMEAENLPCKFFAIVPLNCKIPAKLGEDEVKHKGITFEGKLPTLYVDRAGVKDRPYVNSVYKIQDGHGRSFYAICEYVTIIDTLFQMPLSDAIDQKTREEQCRLLVRILEELIYNDEKCRHKCKIVMLSGEDRPLLRDAIIDKIHESKVDIPE